MARTNTMTRSNAIAIVEGIKAQLARTPTGHVPMVIAVIGIVLPVLYDAQTRGDAWAATQIMTRVEEQQTLGNHDVANGLAVVAAVLVRG